MSGRLRSLYCSIQGWRIGCWLCTRSEGIVTAYNRAINKITIEVLPLEYAMRTLRPKKPCGHSRSCMERWGFNSKD